MQHPTWTPGLLGLTAMIGCAAKTMPAPNIDELLHRQDLRQNTFGPTGKRLFTERLDEGPGLRGQFCYIHYADIRDPIALDFFAGSQPVLFQRQQYDWYPSHVAIRWRSGTLLVEEKKFITDDDTWVDLVTLTNDGAYPIHLSARLASGFASKLERHGSVFTPIDLTKVVNAHPYPGHDIFTGEATEAFRDWYEAEQARQQEGSDGEDRKLAASSGQVLGMHFGSAQGHYAVYDIGTPAMKSAHFYLRAARGGVGKVRWDVLLDGKKTTTISIEPTGGWGDQSSDFAWTHAELGPLSAGPHELRVVAAQSDASTNFDGFFMAAQPFEPPTTTTGDGPLGRMVEQVLYKPGRQSISGIPFDLIDPTTNDNHGICLVGGPGEDATTEIVIPVPEGDVDIVHLLGQVAGPAQRLTDPEQTVAQYEFRYAGGKIQPFGIRLRTAPVPSRTGMVVLSMPAAGDEKLESIVFRSTTEGIGAVLGGITFESRPFDLPPARLTGSEQFWGTTAHGVLTAEGFEPGSGREASLTRLISLQPGDSASIPIALALAEDVEQATAAAEAWTALADPLGAHRQQYQQWFDVNCPRFACSDPHVTKLYWYRWFVARHCLSRAATGSLPEPYFFEGTHQKHFPRLIAFSSPHILNEVRWLRDPRYAYGQIQNHCLNPESEHKFFISARATKSGGDYNNWIVKSAWEAYWIHPDRDRLEQMINAWADSVRGTMAWFDKDGDRLCVPRSHWSTGMEFQPAFFYFNDYDDTMPEAKLERADFAAFTYGDAIAVAEAYRELGQDDKAGEFDRLAQEIRNACLTKLWDDSDRFCYAIREGDDAVARCREVVGFYPFMSRLFPDEPKYVETLAYLVSPEEFWTTFPPATVTKKCPAYTNEIATWPAKGGKTHGCMWNGPQWPHATSVILDCLATALQDYEQQHVTPEHFWGMFGRYTQLQFEQGHLNAPMVTEYYDGETAAPDPTGCPDYFHSTYNDLVIKYMVGLQPANDEQIRIRPIPSPIQHFALRNVRYRGHDLDVIYNGPNSNADGPAGLTLYVDGRKAAHRSDLGELSVRLPR